MEFLSKTKRKDGRIQSAFIYEGKRYYVYGKTREELIEKEAAKRLELKNGEENRKNPTLNDYYKYFTNVRRGSVQESSIRCQTFMFNAAAGIVMDSNKKTLGELRIKDITPKDMQFVQMELASSERTTETVNNIMFHLKHVFNAAVKDETIDRNPCKCITTMKRKEKPARDTIHRALNDAETKAFFNKAKERDSYYLNLFALLIQTGMRVGEAGALTPFDIDERRGYIHIRRTITRDEIGSYILGDGTKTRSGIRDIPLSIPVLEIIRKQIKMTNTLFNGHVPGTIFPSVQGSLLRDYSVDREIERICKAAGIERFSSHAFRATFATRFIEQRPEDFKILSEILGHSDVKITLNLYTHVMDDKKREAMRGVIFNLG